MPPFWIKLFPQSIRRRIEHRPQLINALSNSGWIISDRMIRLVSGLLVGVWLARYLGPAQFGLMNYAIALVTLASVIANAGLNEIVVRNLVKQPEDTGKEMGTAFLLHAVAGLIAYISVLVLINEIRPEDEMAKVIVAIYGATLLLKAADVSKYWFESQVRSKYIVIVENVIFFLMLGVKITLLLSRAPFMAFIWILLLEGVLVASGYLAIYFKVAGKKYSWMVNSAKAKELLKASLPLMLSSFAVVVYMRLDQLMIGHMIGDGEVGVYSAAVRISEAWYFIPVAIAASVFPLIIQAKEQGELIYHERLQNLFDVMALIGLVVALAMTFLSSPVIELLYGTAYAGAGPVLAIHIWTSVFICLGVASTKWYILEGYAAMAFYRALAGVAVNAAANLVLIPKYGILGAAYGTLIAQFCTVYLMDMFSSRTHHLVAMKAKAIFLVNFAETVRKRNS